MVRLLSKELQKIAIEELNEVPDRVDEDIKHIQEWIIQQPHLNAPTDKQWILGFLRGCKFSLQTTKEKFEMYYYFKNIMPDLMTQVDIHSEEIQAVLKAGIIIPLPYTENYRGPKVVLVRFQNCDTTIINIHNLTSLFYIIMNILLAEDDNFVISGILAWLDLSCVPFSLLFQLTPTFIKNCLNYAQNVFPLRIKGVHATGSFALAEQVFNLVKGVLGHKLKDRIFIHSEGNFKNIFKSVPESYMPNEYGGENSNIEEITAYWINKVESYSAWITESNKYITNESMRPRKSVSLDGIVGIDGSFRKLNID